jgi:hypothetical protein
MTATTFSTVSNSLRLFGLLESTTKVGFTSR